MLRADLLVPVDEAVCRAPFLWIGTWSMGGEGFGPHDERESMDVLLRAADEGIRHFDTAGLYAHGRSEELLSRLIRKKRGSFFISTKGGLVWKGRRVEHSASPDSLRLQLKESMKRLGTDYIDLYQLHWPDPRVPISESIDALRSFRDEGLIRHWGVGNLNSPEVERYIKAGEMIPHQVHFNPIRRAEDILRAGKDRCINSIISPLEQGLLTDSKAGSGRKALTKRDLRRRNPCFYNEEVLSWCEKLRNLCRENGLKTALAVLLWISSRPSVHVLIPGPRRKYQFEEIAGFLTLVERCKPAREGDAIISDDSLEEFLFPQLINHLENAPQCGDKR